MMFLLRRGVIPLVFFLFLEVTSHAMIRSACVEIQTSKVSMSKNASLVDRKAVGAYCQMNSSFPEYNS